MYKVFSLINAPFLFCGKKADQNTIKMVFQYISCEPPPPHEKMCLCESPTSQDTNRPLQPQKLARVLKFRLKNLEILYYISSEQQRR